MTQTAINNAVNSVVNQYTGLTIAYPGVDLGQCPAPVCYYLRELGCPIPAMAHNRADGWGVSFPGELTPFFMHEVFQPGKPYPKGTILMWNSPHIAIVLSSDGSNNAEVFEQNADPDGAPCHSISRAVTNGFHTCTYALIPIVEAEAPTPPPIPFTVTPAIDPRPLVIIRETSRWRLTYSNITDMANNPVGPAHTGDRFTATSLVSHIDGHYYFREDGSDDTGWEVNDCTDYIAPAPAPVIPVPVVPGLVTAAPATSAPNLLDTYVMKVPLNGYSSPAKALSSTPPVLTTFKQGTYFVYSRLNGMMNLTQVAGTSGAWINPTLNVAPPPKPVAPVAPSVVKPAASVDNSWKTMVPLRDDRKAVQYKFQSNYSITDLGEQRSPIAAHRGDPIFIYGTFIKDNVEYYRPRLEADVTFQYWFGIPVLKAIIEPYTSVQDVVDNAAATYEYPKKVGLPDKMYVAGQRVEKYWDIIVKKIKKL